MAKRGARATVVIEGADKIVAELERRGVSANRVLADALTEAGEIIGRDAQARVRPVSDRVADAIKVQLDETRPGKAVVKVGIEKKLVYIGRFIERGTSPHQVTAVKAKALAAGDVGIFRRVTVNGMRAHPFMQPAFDERKSDAEDHVRDRLRRAMDL